MIEFGGTIYYIDLESVDKIVNTPSGNMITKETKTYLNEKGKVISSEVNENTFERPSEMNSVKYDFIRVLLEVVMDDDPDETDATLGHDRILDKTPLSYRIAFNTLLKYGILKEEE